MKKVLPFRGDDVLKYSITYDLVTPESAELGDFEDSGYMVEETEGELSDILREANRDYGIYYPVSAGTYTNPSPDHDHDYYTKGDEKYYTLFLYHSDGSSLNQEETDFITALLNEGKYSFDEEDNRFYEWGGQTNFGVGGWIFGSLIGGFIGYKIGQAVGYGKAFRGYAGGGEIMSNEYDAIINHWVYFTFNYPSDFLEKAFSSLPEYLQKHIKEKFSSYYDKYGSKGVMPKFYSELDNENRRLLVNYVQNNYINSKEQSDFVKNIPSEDYARVVYHWTMFGFNFPMGWVSKMFKSNTNHFIAKWKNAYDKAGSVGAVNYFYTELDGGNQEKMTKWVMNNYSGTKLEEGGAVPEGYHQMPDGTIMPDSAHFEGGGEIKDGDDVLIDGKEYLYSKKLIENKRHPNQVQHHFSPKDVGVKGITVHLFSEQEFEDWAKKRGVSKKGGSTYAGGGDILDWDEMQNDELRNCLIALYNDLKSSEFRIQDFKIDSTRNLIVYFRDEDFSDVEKFKLNRFLGKYTNEKVKPEFCRFIKEIKVNGNRVYVYTKESIYSKGGSTYQGGGEIEFEEDRDMRGIEIGDLVDFGSKGIYYISQFDGAKLIVVDSSDDIGTSKGKSFYPDTAKRIVSREDEYSKGGSTYAGGGGVEWQNDAVNELSDYIDDNTINITYSDDSSFYCEGDSGEYMVFENYDEAYDFAVNRVLEDLEDNPEYFNQDWLLSQVDEGRAENLLREIYDEQNMSYATDIMMESDGAYENRLIAEMVYAGLMDSEDAESDEAMEIANDYMDEFVTYLTDNQIEQGQGGLEYFIDNFGQEETMNFIISNDLIDVRETSQEAVDVDGVAHFISTYDGNQIDLDGGYVAYRTN